ncbi:MFS transporter [Opitutus sp. ER46]|uniref:MFS transporter n=1 Tax=Opitutus sp. ER46 TaxID=2161864 RepID=UPI000D2FE3E9|nr:MFS transporter [Opitutus sp. ER46]PTX94525.1 MFS transporter [Opitutus sp. ER46]
MRPARASLLLLPVVYLGFISLGLPDGTFGVAWPTLHESLRLPIGLAGPLMLVGTFFSAISSFSSGRIIARFKTGPVVLVSCILTGSALLIISRAQHLGWLVLATLPLGFGAGAVDAGLNGYVARHYSGRHMNWLHACWGIGATTGPLLMSAAIATGGGWRGGYATIGSIQLCLAVVFVLTLPLWGAVPSHAPQQSGGGAGGPEPTRGADSLEGWASAGIFAIYVAAEMNTGLWASSVMVNSRGVAPATAGFCVSAYYGSITAGRVLSGFVIERVGNRRLVAGGALLAIVGAVGFSMPLPAVLTGLSLVLLGLGFAPIYPGLMHEVPRRFAPEAVQTVIGRQSGGAYVGGAAVPALAGWIAQYSLESLTWGVLGGAVLLLAAIRWLDHRT